MPKPSNLPLNIKMQQVSSARKTSLRGLGENGTDLVFEGDWSSDNLRDRPPGNFKDWVGFSEFDLIDEDTNPAPEALPTVATFTAHYRKEITPTSSTAR